VGRDFEQRRLTVAIIMIIVIIVIIVVVLLVLVVVTFATALAIRGRRQTAESLALGPGMPTSASGARRETPRHCMRETG
jgi:hypothetical protein